MAGRSVTLRRMDQPPALPATGRFDKALGWLAVGVLSAVSVLSAVWSVVLLPPVLHRAVLARLAESLLLAGPGLFFITLYAGRAVRSRWGSAIPGLLWVTTVVLLSAGRREGDNPYLLASYQGLLLAPIGTLAAALGLVGAHRTPWPPEPSRDQAFGPPADS